MQNLKVLVINSFLTSQIEGSIGDVLKQFSTLQEGSTWFPKYSGKKKKYIYIYIYIYIYNWSGIFVVV